jgi:hypothetical protein
MSKKQWGAQPYTWIAFPYWIFFVTWMFVCLCFLYIWIYVYMYIHSYCCFRYLNGVCPIVDDHCGHQKTPAQRFSLWRRRDGSYVFFIPCPWTPILFFYCDRGLHPAVFSTVGFAADPANNWLLISYYYPSYPPHPWRRGREKGLFLIRQTLWEKKTTRIP